MNQGFDIIPVIGRKCRQPMQRPRLKAIYWPLARLPVKALIGHFLQPLMRLAIDIVEIRELAQRPEVLANIADADTFYFAFFPARGIDDGLSRRPVTLRDDPTLVRYVRSFLCSQTKRRRPKLGDKWLLDEVFLKNTITSGALSISTAP